VHDPTALPVQLDPDSPRDCAALSDAIFGETGLEVDVEAIADALRTLQSAVPSLRGLRRHRRRPPAEDAR
jgi:hypothetical protein